MSNAKDMTRRDFGKLTVGVVAGTMASKAKGAQEGKNKGLLIDMTNGRRTKAVIFADSGHIILAALAPETIAGRLQTSRGDLTMRLEQEDEKIEI